MIKKILITGGAGFIGSNLAAFLIKKGYEVRVLDNLLSQVHGNNANGNHRNEDAELIVGDVRDSKVLKRALKDIDAVYHFAAMVGVGQSMYQMREYTDVNDVGTATLLEALAENPVQKLVVASSMSIYGEGLYKDSSGRIYHHVQRNVAQLKKAQWELYNSDGEKLDPIPTDESKIPALSSVYAISKYVQERMTLVFAQAYHIPAVALRFFNVYGNNQSLSNPYTGVLAIFASRYMNNNSPMIFEDGLQKRDFVHVDDVVNACWLALETDEANYETFNIGSGNSYTVIEIAQKLAEAINKKNVPLEITGKYRSGDIRHCYADIEKARRILGYRPKVKIEDGMVRLADWLKDQVAIDKVEEAKAELAARGLTV